MLFRLIILSFLMLCQSVNAGGSSTPIPVDNHDMPDSGWYWAGDDGGATGWGVNIDIQEGNLTESGNFLFGAFYTYDENRDPIWYTFSGEYVPNPDVYAWREGRGDMGTFSDVILESQGGGCLICVPTSATGAVDAGIGGLTITWHNPFQATVSIGSNTSHDVSRFQFNTGALSYNVDFLTEGWWQVYFQSKSHGILADVVVRQYSASGLTQFEEWDVSLFSQSNFHNENYRYFVSKEGLELKWRNGLYGRAGVGGSNRDKLVVVFDPETRLSMLHILIAASDGQGGFDGRWLGRDCSLSLSGYFKPSKINSVFYGKADERCDYSDETTSDDLRRSSAYMTYVGNAGDAIMNNSIFRYEQGEN